jgi:dihydrofolate reductase
MRIVVFNSVTLDGVMQSPARPDEDPRGGFAHGGWAIPYADSVTASFAGQSMRTGGGLLFGRRTYEDLYSVWPNRTDNPYTEILNNSPKYVVSRTLREPLPWKNSTLLKGDAVEEVAMLKQQPGKDLVILGSGELINALWPQNLIDEYFLLIHPLVLGSGRRLFAASRDIAKLRLVDSKTTSTGVLLTRYQPA